MWRENIAMKRNNNNNNTFYSWIIILIVSIVMILMLYFSVKNISPMTTNDKKNALKKTLESLKIRFDINDKTPENQELLNKLNGFIEKI